MILMTLMSIVSEEAHTFLLSSYYPPLLSVLSQPGMSIVSYLSLCLSPLGVAHVGTAAYTCCLERGWGGRKQDDSKKAWASSYMFPMTKAIGAPSFSYCTVCFFSVCTGMYIYIACLTEYEECQAFCLFVWIGPPHPQASVAPPFGSKRGDTLACGGGGGGPNSNEGTDTLVLYVYYCGKTTIDGGSLYFICA